jgi:imidazoleglycerol-phosphate dehydratase
VSRNRSFDTGPVEDFVRAFAQAAALTIHVELKRGRSPHHIVEAEFKAMAKALGDACSLSGDDVPSTLQAAGAHPVVTPVITTEVGSWTIP